MMVAETLRFEAKYTEQLDCGGLSETTYRPTPIQLFLALSQIE